MITTEFKMMKVGDGTYTVFAENDNDEKMIIMDGLELKKDAVDLAKRMNALMAD